MPENADLRDRTALLLIDYQVGLCVLGPACVAPPLAEQVAERNVLSRASEVLKAARHRGHLVIYARLAFDQNYTLRSNRTARFDRYPAERLLQFDDEGARIVDELTPNGEAVFTKGWVNPFLGTPLSSVLAGEGISTIVLAGVSTNLAVESAARHAADIGLQPIVVEDLCASFTPEMHEFAARNTLPMFARVLSSEEVLTAWEELAANNQLTSPDEDTKRGIELADTTAAITGQGADA